MAKRKTNWKEIHKLKVHENRWMAWAIVTSVLACAALVGYIQLANIYIQDQIADEISSSKWRAYTTQNYGLRYPKNWAIESEGETVSFVNVMNTDEYFSITTYALADEKEVRKTLFPTKEHSTIVDGYNATKVSQDRKQAESIVLVKGDDQIYVFRGRGSNFDKIVASFKFKEQLERI